MKRLMAAVILLSTLGTAAHAATAPTTPGDNDVVEATLIQPGDNVPAWDFNHMGNGSDKSETLGSPYYNLR